MDDWEMCDNCGRQLDPDYTYEENGHLFCDEDCADEYFEDGEEE